MHNILDGAKAAQTVADFERDEMIFPGKPEHRALIAMFLSGDKLQDQFKGVQDFYEWPLSIWAKRVDKLMLPAGRK